MLETDTFNGVKFKICNPLITFHCHVKIKNNVASGGQGDKETQIVNSSELISGTRVAVGARLSRVE